MLKRVYRLTKHGSFGFVYRKGENKASAAFSLFYVRSATFRIGFSVSNKLGKAVVRNKLKRRMRAVIEDMLPLPNYQMVLVAKHKATELDYQAIKNDIRGLFQRAKLTG